MDGFGCELVMRLPLAQATLKLFAHALDEPFLRGLFQRHRGRCYQKELSFGLLVYLIRDAILVHRGSGMQAFERSQEAGELPVAIGNAYAKLGRLPVELSMALLAEGSARLEELMPLDTLAAMPAAKGESDNRSARFPESVSGFELIAIDGKKLKKAAKRLKVLRGLPGKMLGGKLLVAMSLRSGLATAMNADPDGERNDVPLVPGLLPQVRQKVKGPILWIADRQFVDLNLPALFTDREDHFLLRFTKKLTFWADRQRAAQEGFDAAGRRFVQEWGWIGSVKDKRRRYVRCITLHRPGEEEIILITDLLDETLYPATDLLDVYLRRWGIEMMFQQVTEVFELQRLIGSTPAAMIFQGAFCLLLYNMIQMIKAYVAQAGQQPREKVSTEKLFYDVTHEMISWAKLGSPAQTTQLLETPMPAATMAAWLKRTLADVWTDRWIKAPPKRKKPPNHTRVPKGHGGHTSVWRVLQEHKTRETVAVAGAERP
jgi:DDE family transposase